MTPERRKLVRDKIKAAFHKAMVNEENAWDAVVDVVLPEMEKVTIQFLEASVIIDDLRAANTKLTMRNETLTKQTAHAIAALEECTHHRDLFEQALGTASARLERMDAALRTPVDDAAKLIHSGWLDTMKTVVDPSAATLLEWEDMDDVGRSVWQAAARKLLLDLGLKARALL